MRLSPHDPFMGQFMVRMSEAHLFMRQHAEAVNWARRSLRQPNIQWSRWAILASALAHSGETEEARRAVEAINRMRPEATLEFVRNYWPISDGDSLEYLMEGLRKAGLPD
jgi:adenylate cyclase